MMTLLVDGAATDLVAAGQHLTGSVAVLASAGVASCADLAMDGDERATLQAVRKSDTHPGSSVTTGNGGTTLSRRHRTIPMLRKTAAKGLALASRLRGPEPCEVPTPIVCLAPVAERLYGAL
jgi:hypothetical protein